MRPFECGAGADLRHAAIANAHAQSATRADGLRSNGRYSSRRLVTPSAVPQPALAPARLVDLGRREFAEVRQLQLDLVAARQRGEIADTLLLVEHPDVVTLGRSAKRDNLLPAAAALPTFAIERGGDVTYHGPGQLVGYPILQLADGERDLHRYLRNIEEGLIATCAAFGVAAGRREGATGVWTGEGATRKLASIGIAVKRWVTMHGFALNVATDLSRFTVINPCGFDATVMTSLAKELGRPVDFDAVKSVAARELGRAFGREFGPA
jgi:lipoate-protein ligase B